MNYYFVNKKVQSGGDHEVHTIACFTNTLEKNRKYLGFFTHCRDAVKAAKEHYTQVNGCYFCSRDCHTS